MAAFSTPFWMATAGIVALAAGTAYLTRTQEGDRLDSSVQALAQSEGARYMRPDTPVADNDASVASSEPAVPHVREGHPFTVDSLGRLAVSAKTLPVLDSWLPAPGQSLAPIEARLRAALPPLAAERAWRLLRSHAAYRADERELLQQLKAQGPINARELLDKSMALRRRHFDSVSVQELFAVQEARALYASEVARILADPRLSEAQQAQHLFALRTSLPGEVAAQEFAGSEFSFALEKQVAQMREQGESDAEIVFLRKQFVDVEGAKSVLEVEREQLEAQKQAWELRHAGFVRQRDALLAAEIEVADKQQQLEALLRQHFKPDEIATARAHSGL